MFNVRPLTLLLLTITAKADVITWLFVHDPPSAIMENDRLVDGALKPKWDVLKQHMPMHEHLSRTVSLVRLQNAMQNGEHVCSFLLKSDERERYMAFSYPALVAYSQHIVMTDKAFHRLGAPAAIVVKDLLKTQKLLGVVQKDRRYGEQVDPLIKQESPLLRGVVQPQETILRLLAIGRADYTFNYPIFVRYWQKLHPEFNTTFHVIPIQHQPPYKPAHIACSKNEWGKLMIDAINTALLSARRQEQYRFSDDRYLDKDEQQQLSQFYDRHIVETR